MSKYMLLGTRKGLIVYKKNQTTWDYFRLYFSGSAVSLAQADFHTGVWWVCIDHGHWGVKLHKSEDEGKSWTELEGPKFDKGEIFLDKEKATVNYLWSMGFGGEKDPDKMYLGTDPGGLFVSEDYGQSFHLNRGLWDHPSRKKHWMGGGRDKPGIHSILINPDDGNHLILGISCAGVFESKDAGKSWSPKNTGLDANFLPDPKAKVGHDPHSIAVSPSDFKKLWQQNHCGIYKSNDGAENWDYAGEKQGPAHFGFPIVVHESDPNTAWVVPLLSDENRIPVELVLRVCKTSDGGKSWRSITKGFPTEKSFDVVYRHSLDISGETLAFGTTIGNLFWSNDLGESWQSLSNSMPLIYSLRFA